MTAQIVMDAGAGPVVGSIILPAVDVSTPVLLSNLNDAGILGWRWAVLDAPEESPTLNPLPPPTFANTRTIAPDVEGHTVLVRLTTYLDAAHTLIDAIDQKTIKVRFPPPFDWVIPAAGETIEADLVRGWAKEVHKSLHEANEHLHDFSIRHIQAGEFVHIRARREMLLHSGLILDGGLQLDGGLSFV